MVVQCGDMGGGVHVLRFGGERQCRRTVKVVESKGDILNGGAAHTHAGRISLHAEESVRLMVETFQYGLVAESERQT